jgi:hypothetical protein
VAVAALGLIILFSISIVGNTSSPGLISASLRFFPPIVVTSASGVPESGQITFHATDGKSSTLRVGDAGNIRLNLRAGKYWASGAMANSNLYCTANGDKDFAVVVGQALSVKVVCVGM